MNLEILAKMHLHYFNVPGRKIYLAYSSKDYYDKWATRFSKRIWRFGYRMNRGFIVYGP